MTGSTDIQQPYQRRQRIGGLSTGTARGANMTITGEKLAPAPSSGALLLPHHVVHDPQQCTTNFKSSGIRNISSDNNNNATYNNRKPLQSLQVNSATSSTTTTMMASMASSRDSVDKKVSVGNISGFRHGFFGDIR